MLNESLAFGLGLLFISSSSLLLLLSLLIVTLSNKESSVVIPRYINPLFIRLKPSNVAFWSVVFALINVPS